VWKYSL